MKEMEFLFQRKLYDRMLQWKQEEQGQTALLIEGVRRVGKSTLAETFAKREYRSYILIDFNKASKETKSLFDDLSSLDFIFLRLQAQYGVQLYNRQSVIVFDEVQKCPNARQAGNQISCSRRTLRLYRNWFSNQHKKECKRDSYSF